jgi:tRNA (cmo5U34)-methyltransferase
MAAVPSPISMRFDAERAEAYDKQFAAMSPIKEAVHLLIQIQFADLPIDARILMAGAGTGAEARYLAARFPGWRFTLIDPSAPMLNVARRHAEAEGFAERCTFLADYVAGGACRRARRRHQPARLAFPDGDRRAPVLLC